MDCIVEQDKKAELADILHRKGIAQIEYFGDKSIEKFALERDEPLDRAAIISNLILRLRKVIDVLSVFEPRTEKNILADMLGVDYTERVEIKEMSYEEIIKNAARILDDHENDIETLSKDIQSLDGRISSNEEKLRSYAIFDDIEEKIENLGESRYTYSMMGAFSVASLDKFKAKLKKALKGDFFIDESPRNNKVIVTLSTSRENREKLESLAREFNIERIKIDGEGKIKNIIAGMRADLEDIKREKKEKKDKLMRIYKDLYKDMLVAEELLKLELEKSEVFISCAKTKRTLVMRLWVPQKRVDEIEKIIKKITKNSCVIEKKTDLEEAPILLENSRIAKPFEGLTKMFALPRYNEIDPTFFIMPTFCLFFGLMLTDAIYGIVLMIAGLVTEKTMGKRSDNAKSAGFIMMGTGIAAVFFGVLTGSYLGDFVAKYLMGIIPNQLALWLDPMYGSNAMSVLLVACAMGFVHIMFGHFLGIYDKKRRGMLKDALFEHVPWYILVGGIAVAAMGKFGMLPEMALYGGAAAAIIGLLMLIKGLGFMAFIDLIGLVGNTLSYARLLAMGLTTAGIAMSFNFLAGMVYQIPYVGIVIAAIVFIFGHLINILINSLGAFVHSLRLQYVEHFGTYYSGGGREFKPFREMRIHTKIKGHDFGDIKAR
ncbi:MAG: V-type ATP synthase subunit I [Candidatus Micrarchaeota archaeon]|nr:V-type ATP synthase subunit I [Candidatus Micrarchaeota archaeon]